MATAKIDAAHVQRTSMNLGKIWGMYTLAFVVLVLLLWAGETAGWFGPKFIGYAFMFVTIGIYAVIGISSRTSKLDEYYVAGRSVPGIFNGMATGSDWMSAASFISMAGSLYGLGYEGLAYIMGWTGGYVLLAVFLAPYLRKFGAYTIPDFLAERYGGHAARTVGIICAVITSSTYLIAQVTGVGIVTSRFLGLDFNVGVFAGLAGILVCSFLGGMRAVTWTQVAQYIILIFAYLVPVSAISYKFTGVPVSEIMYGTALQNIDKLEKALQINSYIEPFNDMSMANFLALTLCLMAGTAGLPHILVRFYTVPNVREARYSVGWSLFFIFLLYFTAPAYAAFARWEILQNVVGQKISALPSWVESWRTVGLIAAQDANGDGILQFAEFMKGLSTDLIVLATPEIAGLPYVVAGLVAAGGLAAALSTADGLLMTVATSISHDLYYKIINPKASDQFRLTLSKVMLIVVAAIAAWVATFRVSIIVEIVAWAFSLAASTFFPVLVLGIWWKRANKQGAIAGMIVGLLVTAAYMIGNRFFGLKIGTFTHVSAGIFGMPLNFILTWLVSLMTDPPPQKVQDLVTSVRYPKRFAGQAEYSSLSR